MDDQRHQFRLVVEPTDDSNIPQLYRNNPMDDQSTYTLIRSIVPQLSYPIYPFNPINTWSPIQGFRRNQEENAANAAQNLPGRKRTLDSQVQGEPMMTNQQTDDPSTKFPKLDLDTDPTIRMFCFCKGSSLGSMIKCARPNCDIKWYHLNCVNLSEVPKEWYCPECLRREPFKHAPTKMDETD